MSFSIELFSFFIKILSFSIEIKTSFSTTGPFFGPFGLHHHPLFVFAKVPVNHLLQLRAFRTAGLAHGLMF